MKRILIILFLLVQGILSAQYSGDRIQTIKNNLELLALENPSYNETLKLEVNVSNVSLPNFLLAVSKVHNLNLSVANDISNITIVNNFSDIRLARFFM